ncbi:3-isopropylmalate dehydrogenase (plasmid) [Buchnera aphidicola (Mollitrichosiphum nigrofasciatum)]|uniref:3-isopropylmalate dehydrogenase n=1 Tax=Buchnera aphidicola TaxID=9 RepID=UPI0031B886A3
MKKKMKIAILPGDGIGPEVMNETYKIINVLKEKFKLNIQTSEYDVGGIAIDKYGTPLPKKTLIGCEKSDAILFGSVGGEKWRNLPLDKQPESGSLLPIRKYFKLFYNIRPSILYKGLEEISPIKNKIIKNGFNILCIRELTGGIYFGKPKKQKLNVINKYALDTKIYYQKEIERITKIAFKLARKRKKKITSIDKSNVLYSSLLWRNTVNKISKKYPDVEVKHLYIDNAVMQIINNPKQFDVLLCSNLFGDIISDGCAMITGSVGMLPSASINKEGFGLYEPAGGSAPDIKGKNLANPIAQILSLALLIKHTFKLYKIADYIENAVKKTLQKGYKTADLAKNNTYIHTNTMGDIIAKFLYKEGKY